MDDYIQQNNTNIQINLMAKALSISESLTRIIDFFEPITLEEMDSVKLMNRVDTKFLVGYNQLPVLLQKALDNYRIVEIDGRRLTHYTSVYFDTVETEMYMMHHNRKLNRCKVRMRSYINSGISFFEIKSKNNKGRTSKERFRIENDQFESMQLNEKENQFVSGATPFEASLLKPQIKNSFQRITLVDKNMTERVTLDLDLTYQNLSNGNNKSVDGLVIVEMKQNGANCSHFKEYLNELSILASSMSKYCLGMVLVNSTIKSNRFKNKLRIINKITENNHATI